VTPVGDWAVWLSFPGLGGEKILQDLDAALGALGDGRRGIDLDDFCQYRACLKIWASAKATPML